MYKHTFYWIYRTLQRIKTNDQPAFNSCLLITILHMLNAAVIIKLLSVNINKDYLDKQPIATLAIGAYLAVFCINYLLLFRERAIIIQKIELLSFETRRKSKQIALWYVIGSIALFVLTVLNS